MPMQWKHSIKDFRWQTCDISGLPVATIERIGQGRYIMACPLCGAGHCLLDNQPTTGIYAPLCTNGDHQTLWAFYRRQWIGKYPEAASHRTIMLKAVEAVDPVDTDQEATSPPLEIAEKSHRRQSRKQAA